MGTSGKTKDYDLLVLRDMYQQNNKENKFEGV